MNIRFLGPIEAPPEEDVSLVAKEFDGGTVEQLLLQLGFSEQQGRFLSVVRDGVRLGPGDPLESWDEVTVMLMVGGG
jgi:hypothetical protein